MSAFVMSLAFVSLFVVFDIFTDCVWKFNARSKKGQETNVSCISIYTRIAEKLEISWLHTIQWKPLQIAFVLC